MIFKRVANERKSSFAARFYFYDAMKKCDKIAEDMIFSAKE